MINNNIYIPVKSFTSNNIYYIIILYNKHTNEKEFNCTCGLKNNISCRTRCKHIKKIKKILEEEDKINDNNIFIK
jgi:hypothetical protein